jgi:hypothetical protein
MIISVPRSVRTKFTKELVITTVALECKDNKAVLLMPAE